MKLFICVYDAKTHRTSTVCLIQIIKCSKKGVSIFMSIILLVGISIFENVVWVKKILIKVGFSLLSVRISHTCY